MFYSRVVSCVFGWSYLLDSDKKYVRSKSETESVCEQTDTKKIRGRKSPEPANDLELGVAGDGLNNSNVQSNLEVTEKLLLWSIMTLLFHGAHRSSEILAPTANEHSDTMLTWSDVQWGLEEMEADSSVIMKLKIPKEVTGLRSIKVEIFGLDQSRWKYLAELITSA